LWGDGGVVIYRRRSLMKKERKEERYNITTATTLKSYPIKPNPLLTYIPIKLCLYIYS
jgi:hypothetical protein